MVKGLALLLVLAGIWAAGLWAFGQRVAASTPAPEPAEADGVVALTGASSLRIAAAMQLLQEGDAKRLLISGVSPEASRADVREVARAAGDVFDCCVDLGFRATSTQGNATETAGWTRYHGYKSLIVVTSDYHMPRSLLELHAAMPGVRLQAYPIVTDTVDVHRWWRDGGDARRMTVEYCKYLAVLGRNLLLGAGVGREATAPLKPEPSR